MGSLIYNSLMSSIQYPGGIRPNGRITADNHSGRGASLEEDLNLSNDFYRESSKALIFKKPTPIQVVKVDYPNRQHARITEAYYRTPSTTDYNGLYKGHYIDFEAKETTNRTSFPDYLVQQHQIRHLKQVHEMGGIGFFIIRFSNLNETYLADAIRLIKQLETSERRSIPHDWFVKNGILLEEGYMPRIAYLKAVDRLYLNDKTAKGEA